MSVYSYGPQGPDGQGYHSQGNRRADEPFAAPGGSGPVIDMVPARQRKRHPFLYGLVLVALCGAAAYFGTVYANSRTMPEPQNVVVYQAPSGNAPVTGGARLDAASVAAAASDSVVEITTESVQTGSYFNQYVATGAGSGVIISADGYIVTCDDIAVGRDDHTAACACGNILVEIAAGLHGFRCDLNHGIAGRRGNTGRIQARAPGHGRVSGRRLIHHDVLRFGHGTAVGVYSAEIGRCAAQSHQHKPVQKRVALSLPCGDHVDHGPAAARRSERLVRTPVSLRMIPLSVRPLRAVRINAHTSSLLLWMERAPPYRR